jgi:hypothetical protein
MKDEIFFPKFFSKCRTASEQLKDLNQNFVKCDVVGLSAVFTFRDEISQEENDILIPLMQFANRDLNTHINILGEYLYIEFV